MPIFNNINGVYRKVSKPYCNVNGAWREDWFVYNKVNGAWREAFVGYTEQDIDRVEFIFIPFSTQDNKALSFQSNCAKVSVNGGGIEFAKYDIYAIIITNDGERWITSKHATTNIYNSSLNAYKTDTFKNIEIFCKYSYSLHMSSNCECDTWTGFENKEPALGDNISYASDTVKLSPPQSNYYFYNDYEDGMLGLDCSKGFASLKFTPLVTVGSVTKPISFVLKS